MIAQGLPIYVALEPVDMRFGYERLGGLVRERMRAEPRSKALFVFVGKRGHTLKVLTWDGTGTIVIHKKLDAGKFELPKATRVGDQHVIVSDAIFEVIYKGVSTAPSADFAHRGQPFRRIVITRIGHRDRSEATQAVGGQWVGSVSGRRRECPFSSIL